jgi:hypothetical protein
VRQATDSGRMCMWGRGMENILVWVRIEMIRVCFNTHSGAISATNVIRGVRPFQIIKIENIYSMGISS